MAYGLTNVKGITNEEIAAVEEILNDLITLLGATNNTGGTVSAGTVMAKLNKLLTDWTTTRAGYIDTINTNAARLTSTRAGYIDKLANFGATGDTGGSATAGTLMAKLNKLITASSGGLKVKSVQHGWVESIGGQSSTYRYITINSVNISKSILISDTGVHAGSASYVSNPPQLHSSTQIKQLITSGYCLGFNWAVIEFE